MAVYLLRYAAFYFSQLKQNNSRKPHRKQQAPKTPINRQMRSIPFFVLMAKITVSGICRRVNRVYANGIYKKRPFKVVFAINKRPLIIYHSNRIRQQQHMIHLK